MLIDLRRREDTITQRHVMTGHSGSGAGIFHLRRHVGRREETHVAISDQRDGGRSCQ